VLSARQTGLAAVICDVLFFFVATLLSLRGGASRNRHHENHRHAAHSALWRPSNHCVLAMSPSKSGAPLDRACLRTPKDDAPKFLQLRRRTINHPQFIENFLQSN
jgi:hypothetical protein